MKFTITIYTWLSGGSLFIKMAIKQGWAGVLSDHNNRD